MKYQVGNDEDTATAVVENVRRFEDCQMESLPPLQETIDVEALNKVCDASPEADVSISFNFSNCRIYIQDQTVFVSSIDSKLKHNL